MTDDQTLAVLSHIRDAIRALGEAAIEATAGDDPVATWEPAMLHELTLAIEHARAARAECERIASLPLSRVL